MLARLGALFTSFTVTLNVFVADNGVWASSETTTVIAYAPGPCASEGVQVITPVVGFMVMPVGGATRLKVNAVPASGSVAVFVTINVVNSLTVRSAGTVNVGALLVLRVRTRFVSLSTEIAKICPPRSLLKPVWTI